MTAQSEGYKKSIYVRAVIEAAQEAGVRLSALTVLYYLCKWSKGDSPVVDQSKPQIAAACGIDLKTVKSAMGKLREVGALRVIARPHGGVIAGKRRRDGGVIGAAVVYRLEIVNRGEKITPVSGGQTTEIGGKKFPEYGGKNFRNTGEKITPPNMNQYKSIGRVEGAAQGGGRVGGHLDAGASPGPVADDPAAVARREADREEYRRAIAVCEGNPGKALALVDKWRSERAEQAGELP